MRRRSFLTLGGIALSGGALYTRAQPPPKHALRLSVAWQMFGEMQASKALSMLARLGYDGYEFIDWRTPEVLETFAGEEKKYSLECANLIANRPAPGNSGWIGLVNPRDREAFLAQVNLAVAAAKRLGCKRLTIGAGQEVGGIPRRDQMSNAVAALRAACPVLEKEGITAVVEMLNTYVDHPGSFLYHVRDGAELVDLVGSPNVKLLFDIYHMQIMEGNLIDNIRSNIDRIDHFHIADVPGRHEPGTGEINYRNVLKAIYDLGDRFQGYVSAEYKSVAPLEQSLRDLRHITTFD
jgi:hydroxypyruvate isomerase